MPELEQNGRETVLVTGASGGIGLEIARCFAMSGSDIVLVATTSTKLEKVALELSEMYGVSAIPITCDLAKPDGVRALIQDIGEKKLTIDIVVNNAAIGPAGALANADLEIQLDMIDLNVRALTELTSQYWPNMIARQRGGVLNISSVSSFFPGPFNAVYGASKAYVRSFTEALWEEARGKGVSVTCLCPGSTQSNFHERAGWDAHPAGQSPRMSAEQVATIGYKAFRENKRIVIPGISNRIMRCLFAILPDTLVLKVMSNAFSGGQQKTT